ncbi:ESF1 homolog [Asterias rubens]|uniref:ESF1 homolog n=1 Tax=Asterias rubens TaxID=7604 RepID=UPI001455B2C9|nr:ESF1 homolog [Asterias rubens]XP_033638378.1 ESF1 homolog [Asterias rubens]
MAEEPTMDAETDDRFSVITHDPRFRKISQNSRKVKIDKRFQGMFKDKSFKLKYSVDKRGRPVRLTSDENLRRFYDLSSSSDSEDEKDGEDGKDADPSSEDEPEVQTSLQKKKKRLSGKQRLKEELIKRKEKKRNNEGATPKERKTLSLRQPAADDSEDDSSDHDQDTSDLDINGPSAPLPSNRKAHSIPQAMDLARGQGNQDSSSDSDSDSDYGGSDSDGEGSEAEVKWGELDKEAPRSSDESSRLALCNMDWDRVTASDLLVLFNSFKPTGGVVHSVKICPSDFGLEKMREEDAKGPLEFTDADNGEMNPTTEEDHKLQMKLRKYQLQRLKYYFAVIECDSVATASTVYGHCDGMEYLSSSTRLDLRFIPDSVTFEKEPKDVATDMPDASLYKPIEFRTSALHQSRVELTWDETNHHRTVKTAEAFKKKSIEEMDVSAFLASSSDDNEEEGDNWEFDFEEKKEPEQNRETKEHVKKPLSEDQQIAKYRALLKDVDKGQQQTDRDKQMEMEITWEPGLKDATEELVKKKSEKSSESTPWENFLEKKKDKKKKLKGLKKQQLNEAKEHSDGAFSDDELPTGVDLNDPFFKDALREDGVEGIKKKSKKTKGKKQEAEIDDEERERIKQKQLELELLFMDDEDGKKHFNLKAIMENEQNQGKKMSRKKKRKLQQEETAKFEDDFEIDVKDQRFQAMFSSHLYAMDPSDPQFKKTKATEALQAERQVQRKKEDQRRLDTARKVSTVTSKTVPDATPKASSQSDVSKQSSRGAELSMLVKSVKNKTNQFKAQKLKRQKVH